MMTFRGAGGGLLLAVCGAVSVLAVALAPAARALQAGCDCYLCTGPGPPALLGQLEPHWRLCLWHPGRHCFPALHHVWEMGRRKEEMPHLCVPAVHCCAAGDWVHPLLYQRGTPAATATFCPPLPGCCSKRPALVLRGQFECSFCQRLNCVNFTDSFCEDNLQDVF